MTLFDFLQKHAAERPNLEAFVFLDREGNRRTLTFRQLLQRAQAIAATLQETHAPGDRVLLMFQPGLDFIESFLACFAAGLVAVPLQPLQNKRVLPRLLGMMSNAGSRTLLTDSTSMQVLQRVVPDVEQHTPGLQWHCTDRMSTERALDFNASRVDSSSLAFLQYTSGSTGTPKGVMVSHANLLGNEATIHTAFSHTTDHQKTRFVNWLPLYHDMGLIGNVFQPLYLGICSVLMAPMTFLGSPITWMRAISEWRGTTCGAPNFAYDLCVNRITDEEMAGIDLSSWNVAYNGAEPVKAHVINAFTKKFAPYGFRPDAFYPCYGMAEATLLISGGTVGNPTVQVCVDSEPLSRNVIHETTGPGTMLVGCGFPHDGHAVKVVDPQTLEVLEDGRVGEVWFQGASAAGGYWNKPELSQATFAAITANGQGHFMRTGDLGFWLRGQLFITGRLKDLIIVRGQNHYPDDIEATVIASDTVYKAHGAAAFTVAEGEEQQLVVIAEVDRHRVAGMTEQERQELVARTRKQVSDVHGLRLSELVFIKPATLAKTSSGKVRRSHCRELFLAGDLDTVAAPAQAGTTAEMAS